MANIDFNSVIWQSIKNLSFTKKEKGWKLYPLGSTDANLIRTYGTYTNTDNNQNFSQFRLRLGYLFQLISGSGKLYLVDSQAIYSDYQLITINKELTNKVELYFREDYNLFGKVSLNIYKPSKQIILNPVTNQILTLGEESLNQIERINETLSTELKTLIAQEIKSAFESATVTAVNQNTNEQTVIHYDFA